MGDRRLGVFGQQELYLELQAKRHLPAVPVMGLVVWYELRFLRGVLVSLDEKMVP